MFRQIEKIQKMVNSLLGHCARAGADITPPPVSQDKYEDLGIMILQAQNGDLPHRSQVELNRWLLNDDRAFRYFIDFQQLTAMLYMHFKPERLEFRLPSETIPGASD